MAAYALAAGKPKMKKADPKSRTFCKNVNAPAGTPPGSRVLNCQNITMAQFADRLHGLTRELSFPVQDATGLEGGWDFTLTFSMTPMMMGGMMPPPAMPQGATTSPQGAAGQVGVAVAVLTNHMESGASQIAPSAPRDSRAG